MKHLNYITVVTIYLLLTLLQCIPGRDTLERFIHRTGGNGVGWVVAGK